MNRSEIENRVKCLNLELFDDTSLELLVLKTSSDYTYNKALAVVEKNSLRKDWYSVSYKNCFKTWNDADIFLDGFCLGKNSVQSITHER